MGNSSEDHASPLLETSQPPSHAAQWGSPLPETSQPDMAGYYNMEAAHEEGEQHQTPRKCQSPKHEEFKPKEGLEFANLEECEKFYKSYAHHVGFSIHKWSSKKGKEGVQKYKYFVCSKQGFRRASTKLISRNWLDFLVCMQVAGRDLEKLTLVSKRIQNILKVVKELCGSTSESKISELESFMGSSAPEQIDILPPKQCNTKGSGKRLKGGKEKSMEQQAKQLRLCKACGQQAYHDSRNCPSKSSS
ncbi:hypothetical protein Cgig2_008124 [Carnegiea gigantea]|uniref:FAR1 domain-containing protein n=1 Tax=Carnegiea gigantea TaxID=171969 RepID=A0A9Q1QUZ4_9CARY|nr:hypothetical protein Cgig2_008124 [Carnegiea gigantea]